MARKWFHALVAYNILTIAGIALLSTIAAHADQGFLPGLVVSSTIPANGDLNPYGVAFVPPGFPAGGTIAPGDVLVSNFNNVGNLQGTGTTIIKLTPNGIVAPSVAPGSSGNAVTFFTSTLAGLSTALGVLRGGFVVVGNVPSTGGAFPLLQGALQVIDRNGNLVQTITDATFLDSPWDLTINDGGNQAQVFVSNVVSGTVSRLDLAVGPSGVTVLHRTVVAAGYTSDVMNAAALVLGPTGLAYHKGDDILYVASTADNQIFAVPHAGNGAGSLTKGTLVFADPHLRGPLGLAFAPNENLLTANGDAVNGDPTHPSEIVEFTKSGRFVKEYNVDASQGGAFGIATVLPGPGINFAAVDDVPNVVSVYSLR